MTNKILSLKQAEVSVQRFNDMAVPHHLGLLKNHRSNIEKSLALGDWQKIKKEELNAMRVIKQIKNLLLEMDALRDRLSNEDQERFDELMRVGKDRAFEGMKEFAELRLKSNNSNMSCLYDDDEDNQQADVDISNVPAYQCTLPQLQANFRPEEHQLAQRQACLDEMEHLQREIRDLNDMFHGMREMVQEQAVSVQAIADNAEEALENVIEGERQLKRALHYKKAMYPVVGALLGTCIGGPIGLVAGLKAGGLAAVGCGLLGYTGGSVLQTKPTVMHGNIEEQPIADVEVDGTETLELKDKSE